MIDGSVLQSAQRCLEKKSHVVVKMVVTGVCVFFGADHKKRKKSEMAQSCQPKNKSVITFSLTITKSTVKVLPNYLNVLWQTK